MTWLGNLWEWTQEAYYSSGRTIRGGCYYDEGTGDQVMSHQGGSPGSGDVNRRLSSDFHRKTIRYKKGVWSVKLCPL